MRSVRLILMGAALCATQLHPTVSAQVAPADPVTVDWAQMHQLDALDPAAVRVPTLMIAGSRDPFATGPSHTRLFTRLGADDRTWVVLPEANHAAHIESSHDAFVHAITSLLARPRKNTIAR